MNFLCVFLLLYPNDETIYNSMTFNKSYELEGEK